MTKLPFFSILLSFSSNSTKPAKSRPKKTAPKTPNTSPNCPRLSVLHGWAFIKKTNSRQTAIIKRVAITKIIHGLCFPIQI